MTEEGKVNEIAGVLSIIDDLRASLDEALVQNNALRQALSEKEGFERAARKRCAQKLKDEVKRNPERSESWKSGMEDAICVLGFGYSHKLKMDDERALRWSEIAQEVQRQFMRGKSFDSIGKWLASVSHEELEKGKQ